MKRTYLLTGASGFMGSALAAGLLASGDSRVLSLALDDADGSAASAAVRTALKGCGLAPELADRIEAVQADLADPAAVAALDLRGVDQVWHVAARMSYALKDFADTLDFNANVSVRLLQATPPGARFVFISTTGVAGPGDRDAHGRVIPEALIDDIDPLNPYTVSKHLAEHMLSNVARERGIPLTIVRPGSIIGHSRTGWSNGTRYGYYSYLQAFKRYLGRSPEIEVDINPQRVFPVIHIDHLVEACRALACRNRGPAFELFHLANEQLLSVAEHFALFEQATGEQLRIGFGPGRNAANRGFNQLNADNNRFMGTTHRFATEALARAVGRASAPPPLSYAGLRNVFAHYLEQRT